MILTPHSTVLDAGNYLKTIMRHKKARPNDRIIAVKLACLIVTVVKAESPFRAKELTVESLRDSASESRQGYLYITGT